MPEDDPGTLASARTPESAEDDAAAADDPDGKPGRKKNFWRELLIIVVAAAMLTLLVKAFVVQVYRIPSASMENTLQIGDRVLVNKLVYHFRGIARGDIVVFSGQDSWGPDAPPPSGNPLVRLYDDVLSDVGLASSQTYYIKRVIGLPGDHVACCTDGKVTVNGVPLTESSYIYPGESPSSIQFQTTVPAGHLWVMGDHRGDSDDSRYHIGNPGGGAIPESQVVGRAFLIIWPVSQIRDLPIPSTFQHPPLHADAASGLPAPAGSAAGLAAATAATAGSAAGLPATTAGSASGLAAAASGSAAGLPATTTGSASGLPAAAVGTLAAAPIPGTVAVATLIGAPYLLIGHRKRRRP